LCLPPSCTRTPKGKACQHHRVRSRWGSAGRINLIGTLCLEGEAERPEYSVIEGSWRSAEVEGYLDALAEQGARREEGKPCVVVLDDAPFRTAGVIGGSEARWEAGGLRRLYRLPSYCPRLNLIEGVWRGLEGFLMPRRFYDSVAELKQAVSCMACVYWEP